MNCKCNVLLFSVLAKYKKKKTKRKKEKKKKCTALPGISMIRIFYRTRMEITDL